MCTWPSGHWPEPEVCGAKIGRVCAAVLRAWYSVRGGGDGRRVTAAAIWCGAGDGQGKE